MTAATLSVADENALLQMQHSKRLRALKQAVKRAPCDVRHALKPQLAHFCAANKVDDLTGADGQRDTVQPELCKHGGAREQALLQDAKVLGGWTLEAELAQLDERRRLVGQLDGLRDVMVA